MNPATRASCVKRGKFVLEVSNLMIFSEHTPVLNDFTIKVERGHSVAFIGSNSAGKHTLGSRNGTDGNPEVKAAFFGV
jgi:ATPase subunit of ABC transporter with duplicated ATPase domains